MESEMAHEVSASGSRVVNISEPSEKCPSITLIDDKDDNKYDSWKISLIGRLDFLRIKFVDAMGILRNQWKLTGDCHLILLGKGFFIIKLSNEVDQNYIRNYRWDVQDQVLRTRNWIPNFRPENQRTSHALVWVSLPGLSLEYWDEKKLFTICDAIGNPVKMDDDTIKYSSGYAANVLVELDLSKPIPNKLWIITKYGSFSQAIVLNKLPKFCSQCKLVGHLLSECRFKKNSSMEHPTDSSAESFEKPIDKSQVTKIQEPFDIFPPPTVPNIGNPQSDNDVLITNGKFSSLQDDEMVVGETRYCLLKMPEFFLHMYCFIGIYACCYTNLFFAYVLLRNYVHYVHILVENITNFYISTSELFENLFVSTSAPVQPNLGFSTRRARLVIKY
ncbi:uncharacterized protein LOC113358560 [Papaver somniferum]|uniref:uncharacterized protein LOC113358560 n=1 Tax=Papaver somniferum TaxID=3469 RepID=UPI000E6FA1C4|nr:uncharacterized protein LOC113358560 [Papaver somniferum]